MFSRPLHRVVGRATTAFVATSLVAGSFASPPLRAQEQDYISASFHALSDKIKLEVITTSCVYPKAASLKGETAAIIVKFDGSKDDFARAISKVKSSPELLAMGIHLSTSDILDLMSKYFDPLSIGILDAVVLQRVGTHVVRIDNASLPAGKGRVCFIDVNDVRLRATTMSDRAKVEVFDRGVQVVSNEVLTVVASAVVSAIVAFLTKGKGKV